MGFKFVHLTDTHIQPELKASEGVKKAIEAIRKSRPAFCLHGGDVVMDAAAVDRARAEQVYDLWGEASSNLGVPVHYACGNHDVFALTGPEQGKRDTDKQYWQRRVFQSERFKTFDQENWRFVVLDVVQTERDRWWAELDTEQLKWLDDLLRKTDKRQPLVFLTHVPLFTAINQFTSGTTVAVKDTQIVKNAKTFFELTERHNVKAVFQGHTHVVEEVVYNDVHYITGGAVCGDWWKGPRLGRHPEGFIEAEAKGEELKWRYIPYGWKAQK
ncbi:metallophosphoesterase family protein [Armatimonas rosea]|uniref:3',5'-cyclic AMP phosphodiesterase CpdA n=1 Tax=Armatimonas rosea TaxID=685828 RepID=A0A7W9SUI4_ARMRO|nr:metallophosphoesterase [Armatimonas rosea]MBB6052630.1 3',5'-cyclic AMP phosphodiesterase CpdA [Armatimonas rosea]